MARCALPRPPPKRTLGLRPEDVAGKNLLDLWAGDDGERLKAFLAEVAATPGGAVGPVELRIERGPNRYVLEIVGSNLTDDPAVQGLALNFRDISERKALEEQLRQLAFHDPLTLLANRNLFRDRVQHALTLAQRGRHQVAVMFLDLDNFKNINDSLGHDAGDRLLQAVAQRLVKSTRFSDTVARLGGDEFAILLEGVATIAEVETLAASLIEGLGPAIRSARRKYACRPASASHFRRSRRAPRRSSARPTSRCITPKRRARAALSPFSRRCRNCCTSACGSRRTSPARSPTRSSLSSISRSSTLARAAFSASRRWCAGGTRSLAC